MFLLVLAHTSSSGQNPESHKMVVEWYLSIYLRMSALVDSERQIVQQLCAKQYVAR